MALISLLIISIVCGVISSTPPGPINLIIAGKVLKKDTKGLNALLFGIIFADALFALIAFLGYYTFIQNSGIDKWLIGIGSTLIILLGFSGLKKGSKPKEKSLNSDKGFFPTSRTLSEFIQGIFLCGSNPGFLLWWVFVASKFGEFGMTDFGIVNVLTIVLGIGVGDFIWFRLYKMILQKGLDGISVSKINRFRKFVSILLIALGTISLFNMYLKN